MSNKSSYSENMHMQAAIEGSDSISFVGNTPMQAAIDIVLKTRKSICLLGGAGTGKSTFINYIKKHLPKNKTLFAAPTGVAAKNIGGLTLHSTFVIAPPIFYPDIVLKDTSISPEKWHYIESADRVIIDEISMISSGMMECIDYVLRRYSDSTKPFGGKQIILVGDPFQLPPIVTKAEEREKLTKLYGGIHFFHSPAYCELDPLHVVLNENYRQKDAEFIDCLNNIRLGKNIKETIYKINNACLK